MREYQEVDVDFDEVGEELWANQLKMIRYLVFCDPSIEKAYRIYVYDDITSIKRKYEKKYTIISDGYAGKEIKRIFVTDKREDTFLPALFDFFMNKEL